MNVLVTGGAGYIGSHTCKALQRSGHNPVTLDNLVYGHEWAVRWGPFYRLGLHETEKIITLLKQEKISAVVHFAAFAYVGESVQDPLKYYENNVAGTVALLQAMQAANVQQIVFSSSCATYGLPDKVPIVEETAQNPINPYGQTKLVIEKILKDLAQIRRMQSVCLRYFNAAGADADLEIGEDHHPETHLVPLTIAAALKPDSELTVFGTDYPTADGTCIRDYIHVTDLAEAHVKAVESMSSAAQFWRAYNLGTGQGYSVKQVIQTTENVTGRKVKVKYGPRRPGDPPELVASAEWARRDLHWQAQHSSLENILLTASRWFEKHQG